MNIQPVQLGQYQSVFDVTPQKVSTKLGVVEYANLGNGLPLLSVHGGPGGFDQGLALAMCFAWKDFGLAVVALVALMYGKLPPWLVVLGGAVAGWVLL